MQGRVIFLNGTSSSGKTTIADLLQKKLNDPYFILSIDGFFSSIKFPDRPTDENWSKSFSSLALVAGFHGALNSMLKYGLDIIVDHVLQEDNWYKDIKELISNEKTVFVGVLCSLEELEKREKSRSDRALGLARYQYDRVHKNKNYAVEVDTSLLNPQECVDKILAVVNSAKQ